MKIKLGEKIRSLRKGKNISQEILAQYLGVSFQAVSKWENGDCLPDVLMIPAIAEAVRDDIVPPFWHNSIYEYPLKEQIETFQARLEKMA